MFDLGSSRDRQHNWRSSQQPCQSHLGWGNFPSCGDMTNSTLGAGNTPGRQRKPWNKSQLFPMAVFQNIFRSAVGDAVTILDAHNRNNSSRMPNLFVAYFR